MCVLNQLDRFNLANDVIARVPKLRERAAYAQQAIREKLVDHRHYIARVGDDMPEVRDWKWPVRGEVGRARSSKARRRGRADTAGDNV